MTDFKYTLPKYDGKVTTDFHLWYTRIQAMLEDKDLYHIINDPNWDQHAEDEKRKVSSIIIQSLADKPLRTVLNHVKNPYVMMQKLRERYASSNMTSRMTLLFQLMNLKYKGGDMGDYVDTYSAILDRLESMDGKLPDELAVVLFLFSMDGRFDNTIAAIRQKDTFITWDDVTTRLIEEYRRYKTSTRPGGAFTANETYETSRKDIKTYPPCETCKRNHPGGKKNCWWNPDNPNNRLKGASNTKHNQRSKSTMHKVHAKPASLCGFHTACKRDEFLVDSGASTHMFSRKEFFSHLEPMDLQSISLGDNRIVTSIERGSVALEVADQNQRRRILLLTDVLYVPDLGTSLISCSSLGKKGVNMTFTNNKCSLIDTIENNETITVAYCKDGLYWINAKVVASPRSLCMAKATAHSDVEAWHRRLAHTNKQKIRYLIRSGRLDTVNQDRTNVCTDCNEGKQTRAVAKGHLESASTIGGVIHSDIVGPLPPSHDGYIYFITFIDEMSRFAVAKPLQRKSEALERFKKFQLQFERQNNVKIKTFHSDNGGEYTPISDYAKSIGMRHTTTSPYTPESNGIAERLNRTLIEAVRTTLAESGLPPKFWTEALQNALSIRNKIPNSEGMSPIEKLCNQKPNFRGYRPFGCLGMVHMEKEARTKLDRKARKCILVGNLSCGMYKLYDPESARFVRTKHVRFDEKLFPAKDIEELHEDEQFEVLHDNSYQHDEQKEPSDEESSILTVSDTASAQIEVETGQTTSELADYESQVPGQTLEERQTQSGANNEAEKKLEKDEASSQLSADEGRINEDSSLRRSARIRKQSDPNWFRTKSNAYKAFSTLNCHKVPVIREKNQTCHNMARKMSDTPTLKEALERADRDRWLEAIAEEMEALKLANTWKLVKAPPGTRILPSQFVLRIKRNSEGEIERYKARLVVLGNLQRQWQDYADTYAPVVDFTVVRILLTMACTCNLTLRQIDVKCAFLNGELKETIYMSLPKDFMPENGEACLLQKSLYGLKQAPKAWHDKLCKDLATIGFIPIHATESVFIRKQGQSSSFIIVYVDDMIIMSASHSMADEIVSKLKQLYEIKDLGEAAYFLGIKVERKGTKSVKLSQTKYVTEILERFGMKDCKTIKTPLTQEKEWVKQLPLTTTDEDNMKNVPYREAIGALLFLSTRTRPDIATAVNIMAKHSSSPHPIHWQGVKRIFRYLRGTPDVGVMITGEENLCDLTLTCYVDADWATDPEDRASRTGVICYLGRTAVWWKSRKQQSIAVSTCEAEYMALFEGGKDVVWLRNLLCELGICCKNTATVVYHDNQSSIVWAESPGLRKVKHIDLRYNFTRHLVEQGVIKVKYVNTEQNAADIFTKALSGEKYRVAKDLLGLSA